MVRVLIHSRLFLVRPQVQVAATSTQSQRFSCTANCTEGQGIPPSTHQEYTPTHQEYTPNQQEYTPTHQEYTPAYQESAGFSCRSYQKWNYSMELRGGKRP